MATNNLKSIRKNKGLTQVQVIAHLGFKDSCNRLSRWEAGKAYPSVQNALKLAKLYEVKVEEMYK
jgi:transcriptional regulator with XRE-family HTH domain